MVADLDQIPDGVMFTVKVRLDADDLEAIAARYLIDNGRLPSSWLGKDFKRYCRDMVRAAVGAAGAGGWEEGVV